jgi:hypothetical protein
MVEITIRIAFLRGWGRWPKEKLRSLRIRHGDETNNEGLPAFHIVEYFVSIATDERLGRCVVVVMFGWVVTL